MRAKLTILSALAVGLTAGLFAGCQTYDFEPVDPLALGQTTVLRTVEARNIKPNMMLLVDTSGSMNDPGSTTGVTRWTELKGAMATFLGANGAKAKFGLTNYPADAVCAPAGQTTVRYDIPSSVADDDNAALQQRANEINTTIQTVLQPAGGTPTSESVKFVGQLPSLNEANRGDYIILLTDGLPNCNPNNPISGEEDITACQCTVAQSACQNPPTGGATDFRRQGCLDATVSAQRISELNTGRDIKTLVIGFGSVLTGGVATNTLNAMAEAGGLPQDCPGTTCTKFYQASNQAELTAALEKILQRVGEPPCLVRLDAAQMPQDNRLLVVKITEGGVTSTATLGTDYVIDPLGIRFINPTCARIEQSTTANPVDVAVYAVQTK
jgi:hypothetical protein